MKKGVFPRILEFIFRLVLGILFIYSALVKISDPAYFAYSVGRYKILPDLAVSIFSLTIPMLELLAGLAILLTKWLRESALLVAGMLSMFIIALVQALARGLEISCGCFGVPSVGGRGEIVIALVRDMMLIGFAIWLMSRPNTKIEPLRRMSKAWRTICLCGFGILLAAWFAKDIATSGGFVLRLPPNAKDATVAGPKGQGFVVSSGAIRPGEWNVDFNGVLEKAEREQYPMVLLHVGNGCQHCARLEESIAGEAFRLWREDRVPLMAFVKDKSSLYTPETVKASYDFARGIKKSLSAYPYVCVYWPHDGVTNRVAFCGRRGIMGGRKDRLLVMELMSALDHALGERWTAGRKTLESIVRAATVQISARAEGTDGTVVMTPKNGLLREGEQVEIDAYPNAGYAFLDWRKPNGSLAGLASRLIVHGGMPVGRYTARFKKRSQCSPPELLSPTEATISMRISAPIVRYTIRVSDACRPVSFRANSKLPFGFNLDSGTGVISGTPHFLGTNTVTIAVIGNDLKRTEKTVQLTIIVDDDESSDDTAESVD